MKTPVSVLGSLLLGLATTQAAGQAVLRGRVVDDSSRSPVADVEILLLNAPPVTSDVSGGFILEGIPQGIQWVVLRKIGFRPVRLRVLVVTGDTLERVIPMTRSAVELPPLEVTASPYPPGMEKFAERRARGVGTFWDSKVMRASEHRRLPDMLSRVSGVRAMYGRNRTVVVTRRGGGGIAMSGRERPCYMAVWVDGVQVFGATALGPIREEAVPDLEKYKPGDLEAVEIYPGPASLPQDLSGTGGNCGAIVLWTRRK